MIERKFVAHNVKEFLIQEFIREEFKNAGISTAKLVRTPLGVKIAIYSSKPGLIVGRKGENIKSITDKIKAKFKLDNPEIEIHEVEYPSLDAQIIAEKIAANLERYGSSKFKAVGYSAMTEVMGAGALGIEILISGKIPGARAKKWRFYQGYLKKCGDIAHSGVKKAYTFALTKSGIIGVQVRIMPAELAKDLKIEIVGKSESADSSGPAGNAAVKADGKDGVAGAPAENADLVSDENAGAGALDEEEHAGAEELAENADLSAQPDGKKKSKKPAVAKKSSTRKKSSKKSVSEDA